MYDFVVSVIQVLCFSYYSGFRTTAGLVTRIGTAGGDQEYSIVEAGKATTCTLFITTDGNVLQFGLDDSQTDTKRIWQLTVDINVNNILNMDKPFGENYARYQNYEFILLQNGSRLIWN